MTFFNIQKEIPDVLLDIRYCSTYNFVGTIIEGYIDPIALGTKELVQALQNVNEQVKKDGYRLKIYDAYRPQKAVSHFYQWVQDPTDQKMKDIFYPKIDKKTLFEAPYLIEKSAHSRGSTVDLTLFDERKGCDIDMGSPFDLFDEVSHALYTKTLTRQQIENRRYLRQCMLRSGFVPLETEWWHFTLQDEPYPNTYFDVDVSIDQTIEQV